MRGMKGGLIALAALAGLAPAHAQQRLAPETWVVAADFPPVSGDGSIYLEYAITAEGRITDCSVRHATVQSEFAATACTKLVERARYVPAFDTAGKALASRDTISISWNDGTIRIPGNIDFGGAIPASNPQSWITHNDIPQRLIKEGIRIEVPMFFEIGADGRVSSCRNPDKYSPSDIGDHACRLLKMRARFEMPRGQDGAPFATSGRAKITWRTGL